MFKSLYSKLALTLFAVFSLLATLLVFLHLYSNHLYQLETQQKLNKDLAAHIAREYKIFENGMIYEDRLQELFHTFMQINPAIELYSIDAAGKIVGYNAPDEKIVRTHIDLQPVKDFIQGVRGFPIEGSDPRDIENNKIFSVVPLKQGDQTRGYLYIILAGERFNSVVSHLMNSYIINTSTWVIVIVLVFSLLLALLVFRYMTKRLGTLSGKIEQFKHSGFSTISAAQIRHDKSSDEIDDLTYSFYEMANTIVRQLNKLKQSDVQRRELIANVSHDLRTPLTAMQGYLETFLRKSNELNEVEKEHYIETALQHSQRLANLVSELFELARLDANETRPRLEAFSLPELVHDVIHKYWLMTSKRNISVETQFDKSLPFVHADLGLIERVIQNLLENAIRYTPDDGRIVISLTRAGDAVTVQVKDNGCGIAEKELPLIFERFYRPEKSRQQSSGGAGLGLAISKRILELHGSTIQAFSRINQGTEFRFHLPIHQA
jgi:signal transduction histidine kinase